MAELVGGASTHVGKVRSLNEDAYLLDRKVFAVADGMGGHLAGEVASEIAIDACGALVTDEPLPISAVAEMVAAANDSVRRYARHHGTEGMGSTLVGAALVDNAGVDSLLVFNVGDSRCYVLPDGGRLAQLTVDHSLVQELIDTGELAPENARRHPDRNVVTRAVGIEDAVAADYFVVPDNAPARLLFCSDGVYTELLDDQLERLLGSDLGPAEAAQSIVDAVLMTRASDNATALVLDYTPANLRGASNEAIGEEIGPPSAAVTSRPSAAGVAPAPGDPGSTSRASPSKGWIDRVPL